MIGGNDAPDLGCERIGSGKVEGFRGGGADLLQK